MAKALAARGVRFRVVLTGQHPQLRAADHGLADFPLAELHCLGAPDPNVHAGLVARALTGSLAGVELVVVQGDTSSALGGALGAAMAGIPVAHVEAGLRSHDRLNPWPEEDFRLAIDRMAALLFAPTDLSAANLRREAVNGAVLVTGNTGIDALLERLPLLHPRTPSKKRRILVTCHRRESWGDALDGITGALREIAGRGDTAVRFVLHPNRRVAGEMRSRLANSEIQMLEPCSHLEMLQHMRDSDLILSDSGGMQEEAPTLGVPLLVLRDRTERPEGIASGNMLLVGRAAETIRETVIRLLEDDAALEAMRKPALPYGDGHASERIALAIETWLSGDRQPASLAA